MNDIIMLLIHGSEKVRNPIKFQDRLLNPVLKDCRERINARVLRQGVVLDAYGDAEDNVFQITSPMWFVLHSRRRGIEPRNKINRGLVPFCARVP